MAWTEQTTLFHVGLGFRVGFAGAQQLSIINVVNDWVWLVDCLKCSRWSSFVSRVQAVCPGSSNQLSVLVLWKTLNCYMKRLLQDSAIIFYAPLLEESPCMLLT